MGGRGETIATGSHKKTSATLLFADRRLGALGGLVPAAGNTTLYVAKIEAADPEFGPIDPVLCLAGAGAVVDGAPDRSP